jgi:hypothetical protein
MQKYMFLIGKFSKFSSKSFEKSKQSTIFAPEKSKPSPTASREAA